jgi:hypothetical protein
MRHIRSSVAVLVFLSLLLVVGCAGVQEQEPQIRAEEMEKTYDLPLDRVYAAVEAQLEDWQAEIQSGTPETLSLSAAGPAAVVEGEVVDWVAPSAGASDGAPRLRYAASFELVVEGVTVRTRIHLVDDRGEMDRPVQSVSVYRQYWQGVDRNL